MESRIIYGPEVVSWVARKTNEYGNYGAAVGIGLAKEALIAGVVFNDYNGVNMCIHVASDGSKRWMNRAYLLDVFDYAFNRAKVKRLTALVGEGNKQARIFNEHIGFVLETTLEHAHPTGGLLVYRMFKDECRWIGRDFEKRYAKAA